jgi:hypothetical protein
MPGDIRLARNFPAKVGTPPGSNGNQAAQGGTAGASTGPVAGVQPQGTTQPSVPQPTFSAKDTGQVPNKEQEGVGLQP